MKINVLMLGVAATWEALGKSMRGMTGLLTELGDTPLRTYAILEINVRIRPLIGGTGV